MIDKTCKRILHVVSAMHRGGAETMIMNLYRNIDREKVQFDFIVHSDIKGHYEDEIMDLGGRVIRCDSLGKLGPIRYIKELSNRIKENGPFHAVHSHTDFQGGFVAIASRNAGIENRICHSHNTRWIAEPTIINKIQLFIFKQIIDKYATDYCSCGIESSKFLFKNNKINKNKINYLNNGIEIEKFNNDYDCNYIKNEFDIDKDTIVIGNIGRFCNQKNHKFIIKVANLMKKKGYKFKLLLIGEGPLLNDIKREVDKLGLSKEVLFLGVREDIPNLMKVFDILLFPSLFEGLPVVLVEAQAAGLPCVISDTITKEIDMGLGLIKYQSLEDDLDIWINNIFNLKNTEIPDFKTRLEVLKNRGYDVKDNIKKIERLYHI